MIPRPHNLTVIGLAVGMIAAVATIALAHPGVAPTDERGVEVDVRFDLDLDLAGRNRRDPAASSTSPAIRDAPPIAEVIAAAHATAGLDDDPARALGRRARLAGMVPWVSIRAGRTRSWRDGEPGVGHGDVVDVRATWRLDRLVFDPRELQVSSLRAARRRERASLTTTVIRSYFRWLRARDGLRPLDAAEAAAELDGLTDGGFSEALRRTASESRTPRRPADTP